MTPSESMSDFFESLREGSIISPRAYAERMQLSPGQLAESAHVAPETIDHSPSDERLQAYMRSSLSVMAILLEVNAGDVARAAHWFHNVPLHELGGQTAERYVAGGKAEVIRTYVSNLSAGATG